jgi:hypothetical protein
VGHRYIGSRRKANDSLHLLAGFFVPLGGTAAANVNSLISDADLLFGEEKLVYDDPCNQIIERRPGAGGKGIGFRVSMCPSADAKSQQCFGSGWRRAIASSAVMSWITAAIPLRID